MIRYLTTALALAVLALTVILRLNDPVEIAGFRHQVFDLYQRWQPGRPRTSPFISSTSTRKA